MFTSQRWPLWAALLVVGGVASCTSLAGLDGDYALGQGGTSASSSGTGGTGGSSSTSSGTGGGGATSSGTGGQGATGGSTSSGTGGSGGTGGAGGAGGVGGAGGEAGAGGEGGAGGGPLCTPIGLTDAFNGNTVNLTNWNTQGQTNMIVVSGGTLKLDGGQLGVSSGWAGLVSSQPYAFQGKCVWIEVLDVHHNGNVGGTYWQLYSTTGNVSFEVVQGSLGLHISTPNGPADLKLTYSPTTHRWWRIREDSGTLYLDTAPDGKAWTQRHSAPSPAFLNQVAVGLGVTGANVAPVVDYTEMDNLNVAAP